MAVIGFDDKSKSFRTARNYTPFLAQIQFCMRIIMLEHAIPFRERDQLSQALVDTSEPDPLTRFITIRDMYLTCGQPYPFHDLHTLLQYGIHVANDEGGKERVTWSDDKLTMYFDGRPIELQTFRAWTQSMINDLRQQAIGLTFTDCLPGLDLYAIKDNMTLANFGYSFVTDPENESLRYGRIRILGRLRDQGQISEWFTPITDNDQPSDSNLNVKFNLDKIHRYKNDVKKFLTLLMTVIHVTSGQPARGTELTSLRYILL